MIKTLNDLKKSLASNVAGKPVIYLSGKVSGLDYDQVRTKFYDRHRELVKAGYHVINPLDFIHAEADWNYAMRVSIILLGVCTHICLLHDWQDSPGAKIEFELAQRFNLSLIAA